MNDLDELNRRLRLVEAALSCDFRVRAQTPLSKGQLAFGKLRGEWCLIFVDEAGEEKQLCDTSIKLRLEAVAALAALEAKLLAADGASAAAVQDANNVLGDWLVKRGGGFAAPWEPPFDKKD